MGNLKYYLAAVCLVVFAFCCWPSQATELRVITRSRGFTLLNVSTAGIFTTAPDGSRYVQSVNTNDIACTVALAGACWYNLTTDKFRCCNAAGTAVTVGQQ